MAYFIAQTPLQLLNCYEAHLRFHKDENSHFILFFDSSMNQKLMKNIVALFDLEGVNVTEINLNLTSKFFLFLWWLPSFSKKVDSSQMIYTGTLASWASYIINKSKFARVTLLDDGTKTLVYLKQWLLRPEKKTFFKVLSKSYLKKAAFFTFYANELKQVTSHVELNDLDYVKNYLSSNQMVQSSIVSEMDYVLFIGTDIADWFKDYEYELQLMVEKFPNKKIVYALHRREDFDYLSRLRPMKEGDIELVRFKNILEIECLIASKKPEKLVSFKSSAVDTLNILFPDMPNIVFSVPQDRLVNSRELLSLYKYYETKKGIKLMNIDEDTRFE